MTGYARCKEESQYPEYWDGLVGYWDFSVQGVISVLGQAHDLSGYGNHGTLVADTHSVPGKSGPALEFDGTGDYVSIANAANFGFERTDPFSYSFCLKPDTGDTSVQIVLSNQLDNSPYRGWEFVTNLTGAGKVCVDLFNSWSSNVIRTISNAATKLNDGNWHNYFVTYDGSSDVSGVFIYEDAISIAHTATANSLSATIQTGEPVAIAARSDGSPNNQEFYKGSIDCVRIWDRVLSAANISFLHAHPKALVTPRDSIIVKAPAPAGIPIFRRRIEAA